MPAQGLGHGPHVVGGAAAADPDVARPQVGCRPGEIGHLETGVRERLQLDGERAATVGVGQRLERRGGRVRPEGHRLRGDRDVHRRPNLLQQGQHGRRTAGTVQADHGRAGVGQHPAGVHIGVAVVRRLGLHAGEGDDGRQSELLADLQPDQGLADEVVGLGDDQVDAFLDRPAELLAVLLTDDVTGPLRVCRVVRPRVADVAGHESVTLGGDLVGDPDGLAVQLLELALPPDVLELLAVRVVGERDHDVGAGPQELPVQLPQRVRLVQDHLGDVRTGLDVTPAFEFEDVPLGPDDRTLGEAIGQRATDGAAHDDTPSGAVDEEATKRAGVNRPMS